METLAFGYGLAEAPRADGDGGVYFSAVLSGGVHRWTPDGVTTVVPKRRGVGGIVLHADGGIVCSGRDVIHVRDGETRAVLSADGVNGFNDLTADPDGRVLVGGLRYNALAGDEVVPGEVWLVDRDRGAMRPFVGVDWPNGIGLSPDGATVYVSDYAHARVLVYHRAGGAPHSSLQMPSGTCDGLAVDETGAIWVALGTGGGIGRFLPDGELDRVLDVPATFVSSISFGGDDMRDAYVTTADNTEDPARAGTLFRTRVDVPGLPVARATV